MSFVPTITPEFGWVLVSAALISFQYTMTVFSVAPIRYKYFTDEYIKQHLSAEDDEMKKITGSSACTYTFTHILRTQ